MDRVWSSTLILVLIAIVVIGFDPAWRQGQPGLSPINPA
jgi:hypothetical protein